MKCKISVSGIVGSGKSSVAKKLAEKLGYDYHSVGKMMREIAIKKGLHLSEIGKIAEKGRELDEELDNMQKNLDKEKENYVMDSRLGFHFMPHSYKIFLTVDIDVAAKRIYNANRGEERYLDVEECKRHLLRRIESEKLRYKQYYDIDFPDEGKFDLVIDTTNMIAEEVVEKIIKAIKLSL